VLLAVHVLIAIHVGLAFAGFSVLSPLEPSEAALSIRDGAINAGAIFLVLLIGSTLVLGRFFCGWACHLVAYQDGARWLLMKLGLRPKPVGSRLLLLVPAFAAFWLYGRPLLDRLLAEGPAPSTSWHLTTDDFWATFPGPTISILTFVVCGGLIVVALGSKGFCTYACPYGFFFGLADRVAPGRVRVSEACEGTAHCTAACSSNVDVAREVALYGAVRDPGCLKCMDCIAACPNDALSIGFTRTAPSDPGRAAAAASERRAHRRPARHWDYGWAEEIALVACFGLAFWVLYDLANLVPFLLATGLAVVVAFLLSLGWRLCARREVSAQRRRLRTGGRFTRLGWITAAIVVLVGGGLVHGGLVQWRTRAGEAAYDDAVRARAEGRMADLEASAETAEARLEALDALSPVHVRGLGRMLGELHRWRGDAEGALAHYDRELAAARRTSPDVLVNKGLALHRLGRLDEAAACIERGLSGRFVSMGRVLRIDWELKRLVDPRMPRERLEAAYALHRMVLDRGLDRFPEDPRLLFRLAWIAGGWPVPELQEPGRALAAAEAALDGWDEDLHGPREPILFGLAAMLQMRAGRPGDAARTAAAGAALATERGDRRLAERLAADAERYRGQVR